MPDETVETVTETPTGADAFKAARATIAAQSKDQDGDTGGTGDDTTTDPPAVEEAVVADPPAETTEDPDALLTTDEVAQLSAKDRKLYEKAQKNYTLKTQKLAAERKGMEPWNPLIQALSDPARIDAAIEELATKRGLKIVKEAPPVQDTTGDLPEELKFLEPVFADREKKLEARIRAELAPVKEGMDRMASEAIAAETESTIAQFDAKYPGWKKHETRMLELGKQFVPAQGAMTDFQYMQHLHTLALAETSEAEKTKTIVNKINKAHARADSIESGVADSRVEHTLPPPEKRTLRDAYKAAKRGERWVAQD